MTAGCRSSILLEYHVSYNAVSLRFKGLLVDSGVCIDPTDFGLHSCRQGAVTAAVNAGGNPDLIAKAMRVKSREMVHYYAMLDKDNLGRVCDLLFN